MNIVLYAVQDTLTGFAQPFGFASEEAAKRAYKDFLELDKHPEDKRLFELGEYDDETGIIKPNPAPVCIMGGGEKNGESEVQDTVR